MLKAESILFAKNGLEALRMISDHAEIDLILLDLRMPLLDGFGVLKELEELNSEIPVIILTNADEIEQEIKGLEFGAVDFIRKPLNIQILNKRIAIQLKLKMANQNIKQYNRILEETVKVRTKEVIKTNEITINALIRLLEVRNIESSNHSKRTKAMMQVLCNELTRLNLEGYELDQQQIADLVHTAPLHDIGKVGIPDSILLKPGKLDPWEYEIMKRHVQFGVDALEDANSEAAYVISFIETAKQLIGFHHEWFDGSGYPHHLKGKDIPLAGRLMAIIDVYDALTSKRVYKDALSHEEALKVLYLEKDRHFDPVIFNVFLNVQNEIISISEANSSKL
jgi:putative two-component system response regulator